MTFQGPASRAESFLAYASSLWRRGGERPYGEDVFRHLLAVERRRADQSKRPVLLAMVSLEADMETQRMSTAAADRIFTALSRTVREVDFIGWHREDFVAAAVLVQGTAPDNVTTAVEDRVRRAISDHLPANLRNSIRVRVRRLTQKVSD